MTQKLKTVYLELYNTANGNASDLLQAAKVLFASGHFAQAYALAYTGLEEISKAQFAADVFTGLRAESDFGKFHRNHIRKIDDVGWAHDDASTFPHDLKWVGPDRDDVVQMNPEQPIFNKRQAALYVDVDLVNNTVSKPSDAITQKDASDIIHVVETAFQRIWEVTGEFGGMQIGTKGFMK